MKTRIGRTVAVVAVAVAVLVVAGRPRTAAAAWTVGTILTNGRGFGDADIAVDREGTWHIVYEEGSGAGAGMRYLQGTGSTVPVNELVSAYGYLPEIAVGGDGRPHIVFEETRLIDTLRPITRQKRVVRHARRAADGRWEFTDLFDEQMSYPRTGVAAMPAITVDGDGDAHVADAAMNGSSSEDLNVLRYAAVRYGDGCAAGCVSSETVARDLQARWGGLALAVEPDGTPAVAYLAGPPYYSGPRQYEPIPLSYARRHGSGWVIEAALSLRGTLGYRFQLTLAAGRDGAAYIPRQDSSELQVERRTPEGEWSLVTIHEQDRELREYIGRHNDVAVSADGDLVIAYSLEVSSDIKRNRIMLATMANGGDDTGVSREAIAPATDLFATPLVSLALTPDATPYVLFARTQNYIDAPPDQQLKLARPENHGGP